MIRPLEEQGLERLYTENYGPCRCITTMHCDMYLCGVDRKAELKKLNRSILICFLELLDVLINNPASPAVSSLYYTFTAIVFH